MDDRLARVVQVVADLAARPLDQLRVLDLGCYEGQFALEFALRGSAVTGIEGREENLAVARVRAAERGLHQLELVRADVRELSRDRFGTFDAVLCLGLLYHLDFPEAIRLLQRVAEVCERVVVVDTHINLGASRTFADGDRIYRGRHYIEHAEHAGEREREQSRWASLGNTQSVWFTRASTINAIMDAGFTSVFEVEVPPERSKPVDRRMFAGVKGERLQLPSAASGGVQNARVPERRPMTGLLRNHAPGTNLLKRLYLELEHVRLRGNEGGYGPRRFGRRRPPG